MGIFIAQIIIAPNWNQPRCPSAGKIMYIHTVELLSNKNEWTTDTSTEYVKYRSNRLIPISIQFTCNMNKTQRYWAEWMKPDQTQKSAHYVVPFIWNSRIGKPNLWQKKINQNSGERGWLGRSTKEASRVMEMFYILIEVWVTWVYLSKLINLYT